MPGTREEAVRPDIWLNAVIPGLMRLRQTAIVRGHLGLHSRFQVTLGHSVRSCLKQKKEWMLDGKKTGELVGRGREGNGRKGAWIFEWVDLSMNRWGFKWSNILMGMWIW